MKLPNLEDASVPEAKITRYLLSITHPYGRHKANFFQRFGFSSEAWEVLAIAIREHAAAHEIAVTAATAFGTRYTVEGVLDTPDGRRPMVRAVWFIEGNEETPRFVTAYPLERSAG